ncbi:alpha/beta hydrolase [Xenophilus aerolatus]|nr:alpha/beta hydrolase [Xenophilus aerolatus]
MAPHTGLTPRMAGVVERMARARQPPLDALTPEAAKAAYEKGAGVLEVPKPVLARVQDFTVPARDGAALAARLYAPSHDALPVLLYFHGGGFTVGSIATHDTLCRVLAAQAGCAVVSLDYRLAPAHRFPTAVHDAWDAVQFLHRSGAAELALDTGRLALGGDSAGGTLAAVCAILARDAGVPVALQMLFYPGTSARQDTDSYRRFADGPVLTAALVRWFFSHYVDEADREDWRFAPLNAEDVEGVAPAWIGLAECDPAVDDGVAYADKLRLAGVPVDLEIYRGVVHEFLKMGRAIPEAQAAQTDAARALREAFSR